MKTTNTQRRCGDDVVGAIMGCVLGKKASGRDGGRDSPSPHPDPPRLSGKQPSVTLNSSKTATLEKKEKEKVFHSADFPAIERPRTRLEPYTITHQGWPSWFEAVIGESINDFTPRRANTFEKLDKIGQGTYSNVYKARDLITGKIVALKKVRFDNLEPESVKFMAREIIILRRLDHPNIIKLEGLVTSRMSSSLYLVFEYMEHDLTGLSASQSGVKFNEPQVKCYMKQLFSGLEHCHNNGVLHRDIKGSNLLIDNEGILKIADFGLATFYDPDHKKPMTSRVVTLWYRPPELLLGATCYGVGVDLWSAGCILAELLSGKPILPGRTEVEQLHKIFKLCGSPSEAYWKKYKLPNATLFKPQQPYKCCIAEVLKELPASSFSLVKTLMSIDPEERGTSTAALNSEFFNTEPYACEPSSLPKYPPSKEMDVKLREEAVRRERAPKEKGNAADGGRRIRINDPAAPAIPAPEANAELQANLDRWRVTMQSNGKNRSNSEKFPPPHRDGALGVPVPFSTTDTSFGRSHFNPKLSKTVRSIAPVEGPSRIKRPHRNQSQKNSAWKLIHAFKPASIDLSVNLMFKGKRSVS